MKGWGPGDRTWGPTQAPAGPSSPRGSTGTLAAVERNCWALLEPGRVSPWEVGVLDFRLGVPAFSTCYEQNGEVATAPHRCQGVPVSSPSMTAQPRWW